MNHLILGTADKTEQLLNWAGRSYLLIDDGPIADAFLKRGAKLFDLAKHTFNPLSGIDYKKARDFAALIYTASPEGKETLTVRNGRRSLTKALLSAKRLDRINTADEEVRATIDDLLLSPILRRVLCPNHGNFSFTGAVVLKLDRAALGDFDCFVLATLAIQQSKGQVIAPDFGFYGRDFHLSLMRQNRLLAGVNFLEQLSPRLRHAVLLIKDKVGAGCVPEDAKVLAQFAGLAPGTNKHSDFVLHAIS